jgi:antitoxin component YwqK of YwqJK toxin-antitoxin module
MKRRHWILLFFPLLSVCSHGPKTRGYTLKIFQYEGTDSLRKELAVTKVFNARNQLVSVQYHRDYEETDEGTTFGHAVGSWYLTYRDTLLIKTIGFVRGDSTKSYSYYDDKGRLTKSRFFRYEKKLKPSVEIERKRSNRCVIGPEDFAKDRIWQEKPVTTYQYNPDGRRIKCLEVNLRDSILSREQWSYYKSGKMREKASFSSNDETPNYRTLYFYDSHGRMSKLVFYNYGEISTTEYYSYRNNSVYTTGSSISFPGDSPTEYHHIKRMDLKDRLVEEVANVGQCAQETKKQIRYRPDGKIAQNIVFTCRNSHRLVHNYVYE